MADESKQQPTHEPDEVAVATKDIDIFLGWGERLENPDTTLKSEAKGKGLKLYDEVDRDAHAGSVLQTRYLAVTGKEWEMLPGEDTPRGKEIARTVAAALKGCNFLQATMELLQAILYGYFVAEVMWTTRDGKVVPAKLYAKHPRRFGFAIDRSPRLLTRQNPITGEEIPERKFVVFSYGSSDNPYGKGLGQKLWWPVWFKKHGIKFWLIFLDKFGQPTPIGQYKPGASPEQKRTLLEAIEAIHTETGVTIPEDMAINLLESSRSGRATYEGLCEYMDRQISKAVLGQTLTTEVGKSGSYAASQTHEEVRQDILEADAALFCECVNATLVRWIVDYNFWGVDKYPSLHVRTEPEKELKDLAERDKILVKEIGLPVEQDYFYNTYNIPAPKGGTLVEAPEGVRPEFAEPPEYGPEQQAIEELADRAIAQVDLSKNEEALMAAIMEAGDFEEAVDNVLKLEPGLDLSGLRQVMVAAHINAEMFGRKVAKDHAGT